MGGVAPGEGLGGTVTDTPRTTAGPPIAIANASSGGGGDTDADALDAWCERHGIERRDPGDDLEAALRDAAGGHPPYVAVVGGDGTLRTAASVLADGDVPLLAVPGGTFNHFARALAIDDLDAASAAIESGRVRSVPVARIDAAGGPAAGPATDGHVFLNTCAIGWYPEMVRTRERLRERLPRPVAAAAAFAAHLPRLRRFSVAVDGVEHRAWLLWAGNGRYGTAIGDVAERENLDAGVLDVRIALADARFARARVLADLLRGRLDDSDRLERTVTARPVAARFSRRQVTAALDAEVVELRSPFTFVPAARWLPVLVPPTSTTTTTDD